MSINTLKVIRPGNGVPPKDGQVITMRCSGKFKDGTVFLQETLLEFVLGEGEVVKGFEDAARRMSLGEKSTVTLPPALAYGEEGFAGIIGPNADVIFDVEILAFT